MRYLIALAPLALLAACGGNKAANNSAANNVAPANSATTNAAAPVAPPVTMAPAAPAAGQPVQAGRDAMIAECAREAGPEMPAGADVESLCGCAVDQVVAGASEADATRACAAQIGVAMPAD